MALILSEIPDTDRIGPIGSLIPEFCLKTVISFIPVKQIPGTKVKNHKMQQLISMK